MRFGRAALCAVIALDGLLIAGGFLTLAKVAQAESGSVFELRPTASPEPMSYPAARTARGKAMRVEDAADSARLAACHIQKALLRGAEGPKRVTLTALRTSREAPHVAQNRPEGCGTADTSPYSVRASLVVWRGKVWKHQMDLWKALTRAEQAIEEGAKRARVILRATWKPMDQLIAAIARRYGVDPGAAVRVATCESGLNPNADNGGCCAGLFQQHRSYFAGRAEAAGYGGGFHLRPGSEHGDVDVDGSRVGVEPLAVQTLKSDSWHIGHPKV